MAIKYTIGQDNAKRLYLIDINVSFRLIMNALKRVEGYKSIQTSTWILTDDYYHKFEIDGVMFELNSPLGDYIIEPMDLNCQQVIYEKIEASFESISWYQQF